MTAIKIFDNIEENDWQQMLECFGAKRKKFAAGSNISARINADKTLGVLLAGEADLVRYDYDGYRNIMEHLTVGDIFGAPVTAAAGDEELSVTCDRKCEVLFMDYDDVIKRCPKACAHHSTLVNNLLRIMTEKVQNLRTHIEVLSQRSLRTKLLTYFRKLAKKENAPSFTLPFTLADLADYLFVDRSAMLREMKKLRDEGLLNSRGRKITLRPN